MGKISLSRLMDRVLILAEVRNITVTLLFFNPPEMNMIQNDLTAAVRFPSLHSSCFARTGGLIAARPCLWTVSDFGCCIYLSFLLCSLSWSLWYVNMHINMRGRRSRTEIEFLFSTNGQHLMEWQGHPCTYKLIAEIKETQKTLTQGWICFHLSNRKTHISRVNLEIGMFVAKVLLAWARSSNASWHP